MTLKEFKELVNNPYEVYTPTDDTNYDVFTLRTQETYKRVDMLKEDAYLHKEIEYFDAYATDDDDCVIHVYMK